MTSAMKKPSLDDESFHDSEIVGINHAKPHQRVTIFLDQPDGTRARLTLEGVQAIRVVDFISQNVISRILHFTSDNADISTLTRIVRWANSLSDGTCLISDEAISVCVRDVSNSCKQILAIEPSWGAEMACVFQDYFVERDESASDCTAV